MFMTILPAISNIFDDIFDIINKYGDIFKLHPATEITL